MDWNWNAHHVTGVAATNARTVALQWQNAPTNTPEKWQTLSTFSTATAKASCRCRAVLSTNPLGLFVPQRFTRSRNR